MAHCKYLRCRTCEQLMVVGPQHEVPADAICIYGRCKVEEISEKEAERLTEEIRDERERERQNSS